MAPTSTVPTATVTITPLASPAVRCSYPYNFEAKIGSGVNVQCTDPVLLTNGQSQVGIAAPGTGKSIYLFDAHIGYPYNDPNSLLTIRFESDGDQVLPDVAFRGPGVFDFSQHEDRPICLTSGKSLVLTQLSGAGTSQTALCYVVGASVPGAP